MPTTQRFQGKFLSLAFVLTSAALFCRTAPCADTLDTRVKLVDGRQLEGTATYTLTNRGKHPIQTVAMWLYPNRFTRGWEQLEDYELNWLYPRGKSAGEMRIFDVRVNGTDVDDHLKPVEVPMPPANRPVANAMVHIPLPSPLAPGDMVQIDLAYRVRIPKRRGRFGRHGDTVSLCGGWAPIPAGDLSGEATDFPLVPLNTTVHVTVPNKMGLVAPGLVVSKEDSERSHTFTTTDVDIPLVFLPQLEVTRTTVDGVAITHITRHYQAKVPGWTDRGPPERSRNGVPTGFPDADYLNRGERAIGLAKKTLEAHREQGGNLPQELTMVEIPAWDELVQHSGNLVIVSEQLWKLVPAKKALAFHDLALVRNIGTVLARPHAMATERAGRVDLTAQIAGILTSEVYLESARSKPQDLHDLVGGLSFIPYVDSLLYAPQIPFARTYTISVEPENRLRDALWQFNNELPGGKRILAKLEDLLGAAAIGTLLQNWHRGSSSLETLQHKALGPFSAQFAAQWYGPYPKVQYVLEKWESSPDANDNGLFTHQITVRRDGARIIEPVSVLLRDEADNETTLTWDGRGDGTLTWESAAPLSFVHVDPGQRLVESAELTQGQHPMADNVSKLKWRPPLLNQLVLWVDSVTLDPFVYVTFSLQRQHDLSSSIVFNAMYTPRKVGGSIGYIRYKGRALTLNARSWYAGPYLSVFHHREAGQDEPALPDRNLYTATLAGLSMTVGRNSRSWMMDPRSGSAFSMGFGYFVGADNDSHSAQYASGSLRAGVNGSPAPGHNFVLYGGGDGRIGTPPASSLATLSHRQVLRGFDLDETYGQLSLYGVGEYRHNIIGSTPISFPLGTRLDRVQGVLFTGAGTVSRPGGYGGLFTEDRIFVEAGYGLRVYTLAFGVLPYLLAIDIAVPILPLDRTWETTLADGTSVTSSRAPFRFVFGITQTF